MVSQPGTDTIYRSQSVTSVTLTCCAIPSQQRTIRPSHTGIDNPSMKTVGSVCKTDPFDMSIDFADDEISQLIIEPKHLPSDWRNMLNLRPKRGHREQQLDLTGENGSQFRIILRQSNINPLDFSIILALRMPQSNRLFRLRRYNGKSHQHTNHIEGNTFYDFHIHTATERYQDVGGREDSFAEPTDRYNDLFGALICIQDDANLVAPQGDQINLF